MFDAQESRSKVPALKINLNSKQPPQPHAFFEVSNSVKVSHFETMQYAYKDEVLRYKTKLSANFPS